MSINIKVLSPTRLICSTTADEVVLPGLTGQIGVLDGHASLMSCLGIGLLRIKLDEKWTAILLYDGVVEIDRNRVTVLVDNVEELTNLELSKVTKEVEKATVELEKAENSVDRQNALIELKKAKARLEATMYFS